MGSYSVAFGAISVALSIIFYLIAIGVEWGTFNNYGGSTTGGILVTIPIIFVCPCFCCLMICAALCKSSNEDASTYVLCGISGLVCFCGGIIAFIGGGLLIAAGVNRQMEMDIFNGSISAGVFSIVSGIAFYCGMIALLYALLQSDSEGSPAPGDVKS